MQPYNSTDTATARKNSCFALSKRSDFHMIDNLFIAFSLRISIFSIDDILTVSYVNRSTILEVIYCVWGG